jgi:RNA polymerase sigma-70 factor, ECF subfamily
MVGWEGTIALEQATDTRLDEILARSARGDHLAFAEIVREHQGMVFSLAYHFLRDRALAEELAQEVFLNLHQNLSAIKSPAHLTFWLRKVTSHRCIDQTRRQKVRPQVSLEDVPEPMSAPVEDDFMLSEDLEPAEIARTLGMPINTVKSHLRRSLVMLRDKLSRALGEVQI